MKSQRTLQSILALSLTALPVAAQSEAVGDNPPKLTLEQREEQKKNEKKQIAIAERMLKTEMGGLQFSKEYSVQAQKTVLDAWGRWHLRFQETYQGLPILGGNAVVHLTREGTSKGISSHLLRDFQLNTKPTIDDDQLARILRAVYPASDSGSPPIVSSELVVYPRVAILYSSDAAGASEPIEQLRQVHLAWKAKVQGAQREPMEFLVDAHTGEILKRWESHVEAGDYDPIQTTGHSFYSGNVKITVGKKKNPAGPLDGPYFLVDPTRGESEVRDMTNQLATEEFQGNLFKNSDNEWGDGEDWTYSDPTCCGRGQTPAVDAAYAMQNTWDMLWKVFGRWGLDDQGTPMRARVHAIKEAGKRYGDARWDGTYANFGDGANNDSGSSTRAITVGHEFGHGLWGSATEAECNCGESAGLNEGHGDIMGSLLNIYLNNKGGYNLPKTAPDDLWRSRAFDPSSYEIKGETGLSYYVADMADREVHVQGCAYGHAFIFLARGSETDPTSPLYSNKLPKGMIGIGIDKAADIWMLATTSYLIGNPTFAKIRQAYIDAATDLYGAQSPEVKAVWNAFAGIGVGNKATDTASPQVSLSLPIVNESEGSVFVIANATDDMGVARVDMRINNTLERSVPGAKFGGYLSLAGLAPGTHTIKAEAFDLVPRSGSDTRQILLKGVNQLIKNGGFESGTSNWTLVGAATVGNDQNFAFLDSRYATFSVPAASAIFQQITIPAAATAASFSFRVRVESGPSPFPQPELLFVQVVSSTGVLLDTLTTVSNVVSTKDDFTNNYDHRSFSLKSYAGQTIRIQFTTPFSMPNRFKIDNVSVVYAAPPTGTIQVEVDDGERSVITKLKQLQFIDEDQIKRVRYWVDGQLLGDVTSPPYLWIRSSNVFTKNVQHLVTAAVYNLADSKVADIGPVSFMVKNVPQLVKNNSFELGTQDWARTGGTGFGQNSGEAQIYLSFLGNRFVYFDGGTGSPTKTLYQLVYLPEDIFSATLTFRLRVDWANGQSDAGDRIRVRVRDSNGNLLTTLDTISGSTNTHASPDNWRSYVKKTYSLSAYKGGYIRLEFEVTHDDAVHTRFLLDDISVTTKTLGLEGN